MCKSLKLDMKSARVSQLLTKSVRETSRNTRISGSSLLLSTILVTCAPYVQAANKARSCDWGAGTWVRDRALPLYTGISCPYVRGAQNCGKNGRRDMSFQKWRWQPQGCQLEGVNPRRLAKLLSGKLVLVAGDSVSKNLASSLQCILNAGVFKLRPFSLTVHRRTYSGYELPGYGVRVLALFSNHLCLSSALPGSNGLGKRIDLDALDPALSDLLPLADLTIFQAVDWWSIPGNVFYGRGQRLQRLQPLDAYGLGMSTLSRFLQRIKYRGTAFLLSPSPKHYWLPDGVAPRQRSCQVYNPLNTTQAAEVGAYNRDDSAYMAVQQAVASTAGSLLEFLEITRMSLPRADAHLANLGQTGFRDDCLHWCEGGVTDAWVGIIYNRLLCKQAAAAHQRPPQC